MFFPTWGTGGPSDQETAIRRVLAAALVAAFILARPASADVHEVAPGETLSAIALRYGVSVAAVAEANNIGNTDLVFAGSILTIPGGAAPADAPADDAVYVVVAGDTLAAVADRMGTTVALLAAGNGIADPNFVVVGQRLHVPGSAAAGRADAVADSPHSLPTHDDLDVEAAIDYWAGRNGIDAALAKGLAWHESGWQQDVVSSAGAIGVMQLIPSASAHAADTLIGVPTLDPLVLDDNVRMGVRYLDSLLDNFGGDVRLAVAAYYQGERAVREIGLYQETERYVANVLANREFFLSS